MIEVPEFLNAIVSFTAAIVNLIEIINTRKMKGLELDAESLKHFFVPLTNAMRQWKIETEYKKENDELGAFISTYKLINDEIIPLITDRIGYITNTEVKKYVSELREAWKTIISQDIESDNMIFSSFIEERQQLVEQAENLYLKCDETVKETKIK